MRRCEYQESWTLSCSACFINFSKPEDALAQKLLTYGQTHTAIAVAELNQKAETFLLMKREDNKHTIAKIYGLCVFFQVIFR